MGYKNRTFLYYSVMVQVQEITRFIEEMAPLHLQEAYDNAGLIIGTEDAKVTGILICLDAVEEVVQEAIDKGCNLIIAHHPIIFSGLKKINGETYIERVIIKAIQNNISIYAAHTNLDNVRQGVNDTIADKLELTHREILQPKDNMIPNTGAGLIGKLPRQEDEAMFLNKLKELFQTDCIRYTKLLGKEITKVALCGGSGSFLIEEAKKKKADVFITGDIKYHQFFDAVGEILLADIGHYESEQYTIELFYERLIKKFPTFAIFRTNTNTNPINYLI